MDLKAEKKYLPNCERCKNPIRGKLCSFCRQVGFNVPKILDEVDTAEMPHPTLVTPLP
jgi:hypothetical protein